MRTLLEFYLRYFDFVYSESRYRFTDSKTAGANASLTVSGPNLTWLLVSDRGQIQLSISPTGSPGDGFWISLIRQYVNGTESIRYLSATEEIEWARANIDKIEHLFSDALTLESVCDELRALRLSNAEKQWGPAR